MYVARADGEPLSGAAGQRRVLALLSTLAVAGDAGLSRDRLVGLLWPDVGEERARHSLTQALYSARRALAADDLFTIAGDIRLNRTRLTSDVQEFEAALDDGELERAATLYTGPFLDGFHLPGSSEFEQWTMLHRARLEDRLAGALDRLAEQAEGEDDLRAAVEWRKRLAGVRPLDSAAAVRLMTTLAQAGDRAGALQHARLHELLLREQLGLDADPAVVALATRLRETAAWTPAASYAGDAEPATEPADGGSATRVASYGAARAAAPLVEELPAPPDFTGPEHDGVAAAATGTTAVVAAPLRPRTPLEVEVPTRWRTLRRRRGLWLLAALVVLVGASTVVQRLRRSEPPPATLVLRQKVVVAPFRVAGASASLAYLRDGMVELLSTRLADDSAARSVDAGAVLGAWRAAGLAGSVDVPRATVVRLAARLGAERVVIGSVVGTPGHAVMSADVVSVPSGTVTGQATVEGPADSVTALVDRLAAKLLLLEAGEDASLASQTTTSLRALRAFLDAQAAFRGSDYTLALRQYARALEVDSAFALAALQFVRTADRLHTVVDRDRALAIAWQHQAALSERDRALLVALTGPRYPGPSTAAEQIAAWERLADLTPDRADAWYELGARIFHDGATVGYPSARARAAAALRRALVLDSGYAPARKLLALLAAGAPPEPTAGPLGTDASLADSTGPLAPFVRWRAAVARADSAAHDRLRDTMLRLGRANLRAIAQGSQYDAVALDDGRRAVEILRARGGRPAERLETLEAEHGLAMNTGRIRDAGDAIGQLEDLQPGAHAHLRLRVLDALYGDGSPAVALASAGELQRLVAARPSPQPAARAVQLADACVLAQWRLARGDTTAVARTVETLRAEWVVRDLPPVAATPGACAELLDATLAVTLDRPDAPAAVARLDSLGFVGGSASDAATYAPLVVARLHARLGDPRRALHAVRRRPYMTGWPRYLATMLREEGRYAALAGVPGAGAAYARFLALRADPDAALTPQADTIRRLVAAPAADRPDAR